MDKKDKDRQGGDSGRKGSIRVIGIGPGSAEHMTFRAINALKSAECVVGYTRYIDLVRPLLDGKEVFSTGMTHEVERCTRAIELALAGRKVAVVSSGDSGIYGMAGLIFQILASQGQDALDVEVVPGVPAFVGAAAILGAPLMHDFASVSLSDLLTDQSTIMGRVEAAAKADFVIILYNPKSSKRTTGLPGAVAAIRRHRAPDTPVGIVRNAAREGEESKVTTLGSLDPFYDSIDMFTVLVVGNSMTFESNGRMITPRGYKGV